MSNAASPLFGASVPGVRPGDDWLVSAAQDLGDGCWALTLIAGELDATAVVWWQPRGLELMRIESSSCECAEQWLRTDEGEYAAYLAVYAGRCGVRPVRQAS